MTLHHARHNGRITVEPCVADTVRLNSNIQNEAPTISVLVPAYNEQATLGQVVSSLCEILPVSSEILIINDCSTDATPLIGVDLAKDDGRIRLLSHSNNLGKTAALITGIRHSRGRVVVVQDADLEYDPKDIPALIQPIVDGRADVVYGSRFLRPEGSRMTYRRQHAANRFLTALSNLATGSKLSDVETGYKAFRGAVVRKLDFSSTGFGFEVEVTAKLAHDGHVINEVPIGYRGRTYAEGKKIGYKDFLASVYFILSFWARHAVRRRRGAR